jgi:hypothetical protein
MYYYYILTLNDFNLIYFKNVVMQINNKRIQKNITIIIYKL